MSKPDSAVGLVDMLTTCATCPVGIDPNIIFVDINVDGVADEVVSGGEPHNRLPYVVIKVCALSWIAKQGGNENPVRGCATRCFQSTKVLCRIMKGRRKEVIAVA